MCSTDRSAVFTCPDHDTFNGHLSHNSDYLPFMYISFYYEIVRISTVTVSNP